MTEDDTLPAEAQPEAPSEDRPEERPTPGDDADAEPVTAEPAWPDDLSRAISQYHPGLPPIAPTDRENLAETLASIRIDWEPLANPLDFALGNLDRLLFTLGLIPDKEGQLLEIGANPYLMTVVLRTYRRYGLFFNNYFGTRAKDGETPHQILDYIPHGEIDRRMERIVYDPANIERDRLSFETGRFDVVVFGDILQALQDDPLAALREVWRVLKPGGVLVLSTPNAARLENVASLLAGVNINDKLSRPETYVGTRREYTRHEVHALLTAAGFVPEALFTADVRANTAAGYFDSAAIADSLRRMPARLPDLGQWLFGAARKGPKPAQNDPLDWLIYPR